MRISKTTTSLTIAAAALVGLLAASVRPLSADTELRFLSLEELIATANTIFLGRATPVEKVDGKEPLLNGVSARLTEFQVMETLKGPLVPGQRLLVKQLFAHSAPVREGELVLWYLREKPGDQKFITPVGTYSGDFRFVSQEADGVHPQFFVKNGADNRGLWGNLEGDRLWNDTTFRRDIAARYLESRLTKHDAKLAADRTLLDERVNKILSFGDRPCKVQALPSEFLIAATHARLSIQ